MTLNYAFYYVLAFTALSGFGVVFLNPESILAVCFFIFFALIVQNSDSISATLDEQKHAIKLELANNMIDAEKQGVITQKLLCYKKAQLLTSLGHVTNV
jgi:Mitochondrial ATP synthase B chain precursor (ATP-synt_B)